MPLPNYNVSEIQAKALDFANDVISQVRRAMPYGAGNLALDVQNTGGASAVRTQRAYDAASSVSQHVKPKVLAGIARKYGAGNCDMAGSMAYTLLRGKLDARFEVMLILNDGHTYAAFKFMDAPDSASIIVDPWPTSGMATFAEHHFMGIPSDRPIIRKPGKCDPNIPPEERTQLPAKYMVLANQIDADIQQIESGQLSISNGFTQYTNTLCSTVVGKYVAPNGTELPLPVERPMLPPAMAPEAMDVDMES